jgi:uncharacterized protein (TIGR02646 family)
MKFKQLKEVITFSREEEAFIASIGVPSGHEWDGKLPGLPWGSRKKRDALKRSIKAKLVITQGDYCCFCGLALYETSGAQVEHIAPKAAALNPEFMFTPKNLALACSYCNGFDHKGTIDTVRTKRTSYERCTFMIVHPYMDDPRRHYDFLFEDKKVIMTYRTAKARKSRDILDLDNPKRAIARGKSFMYDNAKMTTALEREYNRILKREYRSK